jgi:hypothetical protein
VDLVLRVWVTFVQVDEFKKVKINKKIKICW